MPPPVTIDKTLFDAGASLSATGATVEDSELALPAGSCATNGEAQIDTMMMTAVGHHQLETVFDSQSMFTIRCPRATVHPCGRQPLSNESSWANLDASWVTFKKTSTVHISLSANNSGDNEMSPQCLAADSPR
jgi:hypothetical protein